MKQILTIALVLYSIGAIAQTKHLPKTVTITLTAQQALRLDSAVQTGANSIDSKKVSQWYLAAFAPLYEQIGRQLIVDSVKTKLKTK